MNSGMRTSTGQPVTQRGFLHWRQRWASVNGPLRREAQGHFVKVAPPHLGVLRRHGLAGDLLFAW
jgi:hypothetical protein